MSKRELGEVKRVRFYEDQWQRLDEFGRQHNIALLQSGGDALNEPAIVREIVDAGLKAKGYAIKD